MPRASRHSVSCLVLFLLVCAPRVGQANCDLFILALGGVLFPEIKPPPDAIIDSSMTVAQAIRFGRANARTRNSIEEAFIDDLTPYQRWEALVSFTTRLRLFDPAYRTMLEETDSYLPRRGVIADLGCGEGDATAYLAFMAPERRFLCYDAQGVALQIAGARMNALPGEARAQFLQGDFKNIEPVPDSLDGVTLLNSFIYIEPYWKRVLLERLYPALKPGAVIVNQDPIPRAIDWDEHSIAQTENAVEHGAVFTAWELRVFGAMQTISLDFGEPYFSHWPQYVDPRVIENTARHVGYSEVRYRLRPSGNEFEQVITK